MILKPETKFKVNPEGNAMKKKTRSLVASSASLGKDKEEVESVPEKNLESVPQKEPQEIFEVKAENVQGPIQEGKMKEDHESELKLIKTVKVYEFYENDQGQQIIRNVRQNKNRANRNKLASRIER